jgi:hypothetical protein
VRSTRWGRRRIDPAVVVASSAWGAFQSPAPPGEALALLTLPQPAPFDASAPPVRTPGLIGVNRSPRQGGGTEFAGIRPFQPGDRLRRIHWPRSVRTGVLHVTSTWADHDRHLVLVVGAFDDVGTSRESTCASSLDMRCAAGDRRARHRRERSWQSSGWGARHPPHTGLVGWPPSAPNPGTARDDRAGGHPTDDGRCVGSAPARWCSSPLIGAASLAARRLDGRSRHPCGGRRLSAADIAAGRPIR